MAERPIDNAVTNLSSLADSLELAVSAERAARAEVIRAQSSLAIRRDIADRAERQFQAALRKAREGAAS